VIIFLLFHKIFLSRRYHFNASFGHYDGSLITKKILGDIIDMLNSNTVCVQKTYSLRIFGNLELDPARHVFLTCEEPHNFLSLFDRTLVLNALKLKKKFKNLELKTSTFYL